MGDLARICTDEDHLFPCSTAAMLTPLPFYALPGQAVAALFGQQLDSSVISSVGSARHDMHRCKPCAFVHTEGCSKGANCVFCHLCPPGEKRRRETRRKLKEIRRRERRSEQRQGQR